MAGNQDISNRKSRARRRKRVAGSIFNCVGGCGGIFLVLVSFFMLNRCVLGHSRYTGASAGDDEQSSGAAEHVAYSDRWSSAATGRVEVEEEFAKRSAGNRAVIGDGGGGGGEGDWEGHDQGQQQQLESQRHSRLTRRSPYVLAQETWSTIPGKGSRVVRRKFDALIRNNTDGEYMVGLDWSQESLN